MLPSTIKDKLFDILDKRGIKENQSDETVSAYFIQNTDKLPLVNFYDYYFDLIIALIKKDYDDLFVESNDIMNEIQDNFIITGNRGNEIEDERIEIILTLNTVKGKDD